MKAIPLRCLTALFTAILLAGSPNCSVADVNWAENSGNFFAGANWVGGVVPGPAEVPFFTSTLRAYTMTMDPGNPNSTVTNSWLNIGWNQYPIALDMGGYAWRISNHFYAKYMNPGVYATLRNGTLSVGGTFNLENNATDSGVILEDSASVYTRDSALKNGTLWIKENSLFAVTNSVLYIGTAVGNTGRVVIAGGTLLAPKNLYLGQTGGFASLILSNGVLNSTGGTVFIGYKDGGTNGFLALRGGAARGGLRIGDNGPGRGEISGGTHVFDPINVGNSTGSDGTLYITGGDTSVVTLRLSAGVSSTGTVVMAGGKLNCTSYLDHNIDTARFIQRAGETTVNSLRSGVNSTATTAKSTLTVQIEGGRFKTTGIYSWDSGTKGMTNTISVSGGTFYSTQNLDPGTTGKKLQLLLTGGTLAFPTLYSNRLIAGKLVNQGGVLAPGDVGTPGFMTIYGSYQVASSSAVLDIDLGGTATASGIAGAPNSYDALYVRDGGLLTLGGELRIRTINGFVPSSANTFAIIRHAGGLVGGSEFANVAGGTVFTADGLFRFAIANDAVANQIKLSGAAFNQRNVAGGVWGSGWTLVAPGLGNDYVAYLGTAGSGTITLDDDLALQGMILTNPAPYAVTGAGSLDMGFIRVLGGAHALAVPLVQTQPLALDIAAGASLQLTNIDSDDAALKTGAGTVVLAGNGALASLACGGGTVSLKGSMTLEGRLVVDGGVFSFDAGGSELRVKNMTRAELEAMAVAGTLRTRGQTTTPETFLIKTDAEGYLCCTLRTQPLLTIIR